MVARARNTRYPIAKQVDHKSYDRLLACGGSITWHCRLKLLPSLLLMVVARMTITQGSVELNSKYTQIAAKSVKV